MLPEAAATCCNYEFRFRAQLWKELLGSEPLGGETSLEQNYLPEEGDEELNQVHDAVVLGESDLLEKKHIGLR